MNATKAGVDAPAAPAPAPETVTVQVPALRGVLGQLADLFRQGEVTLQAMVDRFGWQAHSARAAVTRLRRAGMDIVCRGGTRYILRGPAQVGQTAPAAAAVSGVRPLTDGDCNADAPLRQDSLWEGIADALQVFYRNRAAVLSVAA